MKELLTNSQVAAFRLKRHHLLNKNRSNIITISQNICGLQAQVMSAAEMQLWTRNQNLNRTDIHSALWEKHTLVKTSVMRGTLHLLAADDFFIYINALKNSRTRAMKQIMSRLGVTDKEGDVATKAVIAALEDGPMCRSELTNMVLSLQSISEKAKEWFKLSWWGVVRQAIVEGLVCYGPDSGQEVSLVRVDQWLADIGEVPELKAQSIMLRRYLKAYGPATLQDFSKWSSISMPEVRVIYNEIQEDLIEAIVEGKKGLILCEDLEIISSNDLSEQKFVNLLPHFDPFLLGHTDKSHLVDSFFYKRVYRKAGWISPVVLLNGKVIGVWSYKRSGKRLLVEIELFKKASKKVLAKIEKEAASLAGFLGCSLEIKWVK